MSDIKCPVCGEKIEHIEDGWCNCKNRCIGSGSISLWQELARTKKQLVTKCNQLEIAVDELKRIDETRSGVKENLHATNGKTLNAGNGFCWATIDDIHNTLVKITALEQKEEQ